MTRQTFNMTQVTDLQAALKAVPPSTRKLSRTEVLRQLAPTIKELREKGYTAEAIVELLKTKGFDMKLSTFRGVLKRRGAKLAPAQVTPAPAATTASPATT
jgi:transposase